MMYFVSANVRDGECLEMFFCLFVLHTRLYCITVFLCSDDNNLWNFWLCMQAIMLCIYHKVFDQFFVLVSDMYFSITHMFIIRLYRLLDLFYFCMIKCKMYCLNYQY